MSNIKRLNGMPIDKNPSYAPQENRPQKTSVIAAARISPLDKSAVSGMNRRIEQKNRRDGLERLTETAYRHFPAAGTKPRSAPAFSPNEGAKDLRTFNPDLLKIPEKKSKETMLIIPTTPKHKEKSDSWYSKLLEFLQFLMQFLPKSYH